MKLKIINSIKYLQFENLSLFEKIIHYSSTRVGGTSSDHLSSLNLGFTVKDNPKNVKMNLSLLANSVGIDTAQMVFPKQINDANIGIVKSVNDLFPETDALITNVAGICISVRTADCVPILLYDPVQNAIAAVHSGWKGTVQKISKKTIELMNVTFGTKPEDLIAGIGPSIGPKVYEVGKELIEKFDQQFPQNQFFEPTEKDGKFLLNLWEANKEILIESGVFENKIEIAEVCTYSNPELFFSARRDKNKTGRLASGIMIV